MSKYSKDRTHSKGEKPKKAKGGKKDQAANYIGQQVPAKDMDKIDESAWILQDSGAVTEYRAPRQFLEAGVYSIGANGVTVSVSKGKVTKPLHEMTGFEKIEMIRGGLSKVDLLTIKDKSGLDYGQLSVVLSTARATLINKKGDARFNRDLSEKIFGLADIYAYGYQVFEDEIRFNEWIFAPNNALGGRKPFDFLDSQYGREEIKNLIGRIDYGVYS